MLPEIRSEGVFEVKKTGEALLNILAGLTVGILMVLSWVVPPVLIVFVLLWVFG